MGFLSRLFGVVAGQRTQVPPRPSVSISPTWMQMPSVMPGGSQPVVGESHYQAALNAASGGRNDKGCVNRIVTVELVREPDNRYDRNAVRVDIGGRPVGHIDRHTAPTFHPLVEGLWADGRAATCRAWLTGGWVRPGGDVGYIGVVLDVHPSLSRTVGDVPLLPPIGRVTVTGEERYQDTLAGLLAGQATRRVLATLCERSPIDGQPGVPGFAVMVGGRVCGWLTPKMAQRYFALIRDIDAVGLQATCAAKIEPGTRKIEIWIDLPRPSELCASYTDD